MSQKHTFQFKVTITTEGNTPEQAYDTLYKVLHAAGIARNTVHIGLPICLTTPYPAEKPTQTAENEGDGGGGPVRPPA